MALAGTTARAIGAPTSACEGSSTRLGSPWRAQPCWRCSPVAAPRQQQQQAEHRRRRRLGQQPVHAALLDPPPFDPAKLRVEYLPGGREAQLGAGRRYTLTHNDLTGALQLAIGREYNRRQLDSWYARIVRDEILAEWRETAPPILSCGSGDAPLGGGGGTGAGAQSALAGVAGDCTTPRPSLHVYCHVSGEEMWPAPPQLRSFIFQREMTLVLDTITYAESAGSDGLLAVAPHLASAPVYVHLRSDIPALDRVVEWGVLGERSSWRLATSSVGRSLLASVLGTLDEADDTSATDGSNGCWSRSSFSTASSGSWDEGSLGCGCGAASAGWGEAEGAAAAAANAAAAAAAVVDDAGSNGSGSNGSGSRGEQAVQQQHPKQEQVGGSKGAGHAASQAASQALPAAGGSSTLETGVSSNGAGPRAPASSNGSGGSSLSSSSSLCAANGAVSLAAERSASGWLSVPTAGDGSVQRLSAAVQVVASSRQR